MIVYHSMKESEVNCVYDLIVRVFHEHVAPVYSDKGVDTFLSKISPTTLLEVNKGESSFVIVARQNNKPIGMLAVIEENHVALIFVESRYQGKGIGKGLIDEAIKICQNRNPGLKSITVSSSPNSKTFYERIGFKAQSDEVDEDGMRYTPMQRIVH
jgi:predicted GNAT family N-acyltransferase